MTAPADGNARAAARANVAMLALLLLVVAVGICCGEKIFVRGGLGWDGEFYGNLTRRFGAAVLGREVDAYRLQRVLPSGIVAMAMRATGAPTDNAHIVRAFDLLNGLLLLLAGLLWTRIATVLALSVRGRWLGFTGLFVNYAVLKQAFYYPVTTDVSAFTLGLCMLWLYLTRRTAWLVVAALVGAFAWPLAPLGALPLVLFPRGSTEPPPGRRSVLPTLVAALVTLLFLGLLGALYYGRHRRAAGMGPIVPIVEPVFYLSVAVFAAYAFLGVRTLLDGLDVPYVLRLLRSLRPMNVALAILVLVAPKLVVRALASPDEGLLTARTFLGYLAIMPVTRPAIFLVSHVIYFGPIVLLLVALWKPFCRAVQAMGTGMLGFVLLAMPITFTPESRQSLLALPAFVALLVCVTEERRWPASVYWLIALLSLLLSKVWLPINAWLPEGRSTDVGLPLYFMSQGPWMTNGFYLLQGAVVLATAALLFWRLRTPARLPGTVPDGA